MSCDVEAGVCLGVVPDCEDSAECPGTRPCVDQTCVEPDLCFVPVDCDPGRVCDEDRRCVTVCLEDGDCPEGFWCEVDAGRCRPPAPCQGGGECPLDRCPGELIPVTDVGTLTVEGNTVFATNQDAGSCGGADAPEFVYRFAIQAQPTTWRVDVVADFEPVLCLRGADCGGEEIACAVGDSLQANLTAGTYHLIVDGATADDVGAFTLDFKTITMPDTCVRASRVHLQPPDVEGCCRGRAGFVNDTTIGTSALSADDVCGAGSDLGADFWYGLHLDEPGRIWAEVAADFSVALALVEGQGCEADLQVVECGPELNVPDMPAGDYWVVVEGLGAQEMGAFTLEIKVRD